jgi:hypothetical protein
MRQLLKPLLLQEQQMLHSFSPAAVQAAVPSAGPPACATVGQHAALEGSAAAERVLGFEQQQQQQQVEQPPSEASAAAGSRKRLLQVAASGQGLS